MSEIDLYQTNRLGREAIRSLASTPPGEWLNSHHALRQVSEQLLVSPCAVQHRCSVGSSGRLTAVPLRCRSRASPSSAAQPGNGADAYGAAHLIEVIGVRVRELEAESPVGRKDQAHGEMCLSLLSTTQVGRSARHPRHFAAADVNSWSSVLLA